MSSYSLATNHAVYIFCFVVYRKRKLCEVLHYEVLFSDVPPFVKEWLRCTERSIVVDDPEVHFIPESQIRLFHWYVSVCNTHPKLEQCYLRACIFHLIKVYE